MRSALEGCAPPPRPPYSAAEDVRGSSGILRDDRVRLLGLARDRRLSCERGCRARADVSSCRREGPDRGSIPACCKSSMRRGSLREDEFLESAHRVPVDFRRSVMGLFT